MNSPITPSESKSAPEPLLRVRDLKTYFRVEGGIAKAVDGVSFDLFPDEVLGIVGESGSGKSVTSLSVMRLIPDPPGFIAGGEIWFNGENLVEVSHDHMRQVRGNEIGMIFQEPMTALNPVFTIGMQVVEAVRTHQPLKAKEARERAVEILQHVGIPDAAKRLKDYPHQFSGGMRQRVMIAMALVCNPQLLIADEPTTALDVTTQAQILDLMLQLKAEQDRGSIMLITHDLGVVAETCDRVVVMYGGKLQEVGTVEQIFSEPRHPYTQGLIASLPSQQHARKSRLHAIPGNVPSIMELPAGCKFCNRCEHVLPQCEETEPPLYDVGDGHLVRCHLLEDDAQ
ncbi:MAG: ABC transporter ATP-binding protein [Planctomycetaceae bacterium]|nr:ABC transporter ATP-binding protein [Planctomycetaceae bacterium]